jgi:hypothetical protein
MMRRCEMQDVNRGHFPGFVGDFGSGNDADFSRPSSSVASPIDLRSIID